MDATGLAGRLNERLARGRAVADARRTSRCTIKRQDRSNSTVDSDGYKVPAWTTLHTDLPVRLGKPSPGGSGERKVNVGGVDASLAMRTAHVSVTVTDLTDGDILEVTTGDCAGLFFRIVEVTATDQAVDLPLPLIETEQPKGWIA